MQAIMETIFDVWYLSTALFLGIVMLKGGKDNLFYKIFGIMVLVLGIGDSFHLVPRMYALFSNGLEEYAPALGFGKLVTSITMTFFYAFLYKVWRLRFNISGLKWLTATIHSLGFIRIVLCLLPQNNWFSYNAPVSWGIYRNIPFLIMGLIIVVLYLKEAMKTGDKYFKYMWLAITLSFAFYIPVVLWAKTYSIVGMLMLPKTVMYVWMANMGYKSYKKEYKLHDSLSKAS